MKVIVLENYRSSENCYLVYDENTMDGVVIDPGYDANGIKARADKEKINIKYIMVTHCHYDHIQYLEEIRALTGAPLAAGKWASINIGDPDINLTYAGLGKEISAKPAEKILSDNEEFYAGSLKIKCIYTPGHTNCGVCFMIGSSVFSGDTLFLRNCGRWDLPTGNQAQLEDSIRTRLYALDDDLIVYPGHGNSTSIGYEKKFNFVVPEK